MGHVIYSFGLRDSGRRNKGGLNMVFSTLKGAHYTTIKPLLDNKQGKRHIGNPTI